MIKLKTITILTVTIMLFIGGVVFATTGKVYNTSEGLVLRESASKSGNPIQTVYNGTEVEILGEENGWYKVKVDGKEGYLFAEYVKVEEATENPEEAEEEETEEKATTTSEEEEGESVKAETKIHLLPSMASTTIGTIPADGEIKVIKTVGKWNYVLYEKIKGWVRVNSQSPKVEEEAEEEEAEEEEKEEETKTASEDTNVSFTKGYINSSSVNVRKEPNKSSDVVTTLVLNTGVTITAQTDEWYKVTYGDITGYIHKSLISDKETEVEEETTSTSTTSTSSRSSEVRTSQDEEEVTYTSSSSSGTGSEIAAFAKQYLGYSYSYGGTSPSTGFDCSGFAQYVYSSFGYSLAGRGASSQAQSGTAVSRDDLEPGDLIAFSNGGGGSIGHVGIYIGDGMMVHAANPSRGVVTDTIDSGYYNTYYYTARRIAD